MFSVAHNTGWIERDYSILETESKRNGIEAKSIHDQLIVAILKLPLQISFEYTYEIKRNYPL